jgi:16S rRNA (uracil1498-N3)-methyltransferase
MTNGQQRRRNLTTQRDDESNDEPNEEPSTPNPNDEPRTSNPEPKSSITRPVSAPRFYVPDLDLTLADVVLPPDESHHLARVMRLVAGDEVAVFDGHGHEFTARVVRADRKAAAVVIGELIAAVPEPIVPTVLVQAVLKGDKMDGVVRDATMAGVARIVPVETSRSLISLAALRRGQAHERWQRVAVASAKQCGRARLPEIDPPQPFREWLNAPFDGLRLLLAEPSSPSDGVQPMRKLLAGAPPPAIACLVGPEGGWSPAERDAAVAAGCVLASLGAMTFRADAVGLVAVSLVNFAFDEG